MAPVAAAVKGLVAESLGLRVGDRELLRGVSITVLPGSMVGLIGPNGAGKSTLMKLLAGELRGEGRVWLSGVELSAMTLPERARAGLGYLPQGSASLPGLRAHEQLRVFAELHGFRGRALTERVDHALASVGLTERQSLCVEALSGGERRRLEVAGMLLGNFSALVLDEPFAALDQGAMRSVAEALRAKCSEGTAVILSDHARETLSVCDEALLLVNGELRLKGDAQSVRENGLLREVYLGRP